MGPVCSQSEGSCDGCTGIWCPDSADDSGDPTPAPPEGGSGGGSCKTRNCGCGPYTTWAQTGCELYDMGPVCSQSEGSCDGCTGIWCPASSLLEMPGAK